MAVDPTDQSNIDLDISKDPRPPRNIFNIFPLTLH